MQNQHLMNGLEEFFRSSHPVTQTPTSVNTVASSNVNTGVITPTSSSGATLLKIIVIGGLICLVYYFANNYFKMYKRDERNKHF